MVLQTEARVEQWTDRDMWHLPRWLASRRAMVESGCKSKVRRARVPRLSEWRMSMSASSTYPREVMVRSVLTHAGFESKLLSVPAGLDA